MLSVYTRHTRNVEEGQSHLASLPLSEVDHGHGSRPSRQHARLGEDTGPGSKPRSWLANTRSLAAGEDEVKEARTLPTVKEAVKGYLADAEARGLAPATMQKLEHIFRKQLLGIRRQHRIIFLREVNVRNLTEWRPTWNDKPLASKKKFERVIGFFWFCVRQGWLQDNPTATMGRVIAKHVPTDYFTADEYKRIVGATYRLGEDAERSWAPRKTRHSHPSPDGADALERPAYP